MELRLVRSAAKAAPEPTDNPGAGSHDPGCRGTDERTGDFWQVNVPSRVRIRRSRVAFCPDRLDPGIVALGAPRERWAAGRPVVHALFVPELQPAARRRRARPYRVITAREILAALR